MRFLLLLRLVEFGEGLSRHTERIHSGRNAAVDCNLQQHFADFVQGLIRSEGVLFYLIVSAIALTLNTSYLQWRR